MQVSRCSVFGSHFDFCARLQFGRLGAGQCQGDEGASTLAAGVLTDIFFNNLVYDLFNEPLDKTAMPPPVQLAFAVMEAYGKVEDDIDRLSAPVEHTLAVVG